MVSFLKQVVSKIPFIVIIPIIFLVVYSAWYSFRLPSDGIEWSPVDGYIQSVDPTGPAFGFVKPGDRILAIDGIPSFQSRVIYTTKGAGDAIQLRIEHGNEILEYEITLTGPSRSEFVNRFTLVIVSASFVLIGMLVVSFTPSASSNNLFALVCICVSGILASGSISAEGPYCVSTLFNVFLWWVGPLAVHFHMRFPESRMESRRLPIRIGLYLISLVGSMPYILFGSSKLLATSLGRHIFTAGRIFLAFNLLVVVILLILSYIHATRGTTRQQVRIVTFFGAMSLLSVVVLSLLPSALILKPLVPYEISFLFLLLIPLSYGYSIVKYRLIELEKALNRGAALLLVLIILIGIYLVIFTLIERFLPTSLHGNPLMSLVIFLLLAISYEPLRKRIQYFVDWIFYGGWYDYRSATSNITEGFGQIVNSNILGETIIERLKLTLRLDSAYLLRISSQGYIFPIPESGEFPERLLSRFDTYDFPSIPISGVIYQILLKPRVIEVKELGQYFKDEDVSEPERELIKELRGNWISPILANGLLLGLLVLGPKSGREVFGAEDFDILTVVSRHAGIALYNIQLLNELRHRAAEIKQLHQEILRAREEERKRLSLELHDDIIQSLVGLNFDLGKLDSEQVPKFRKDVRKIVGDLRQICSELRPATLDNLGLIPAIRSLLRDYEIKFQDSTVIQFDIEGDENFRVPENIALNIYRVLAESLNNTLRHADAEHVEIKIKLYPGEISFELKDDGYGFIVPRPLGKLLSDRHFGLVGMRERIEQFNGEFLIESSPGVGTHIVAVIPLVEEHSVYIGDRS